MLNFIALPRSAVLVNIVILHFLQVTLLLMFQLVTFIILLNEIFLYSSAPLTPMAAPRPLAGGRYEMNSSLIRNNNNKNTHAALRPLTSASPTAATSSLAACGPCGRGPGLQKAGPGRCPHLRPSRHCDTAAPSNPQPHTPPPTPAPQVSILLTVAAGWPHPLPLPSLFSPSGPLPSISQAPLSSCLSSESRLPSVSCSLFHFFIFRVSSLHILPFFFLLRRPEAIWAGVGSPGRDGPCQ